LDNFAGTLRIFSQPTFQTAGNTYVTIDTSGNVGIKNANFLPGYIPDLDVRGDSSKTVNTVETILRIGSNDSSQQFQLYFGLGDSSTPGSRYAFIDCDDDGTKRDITLNPWGGNIRIGALSSNGAVYSNANTLTNTNPSSKEYKQNIMPAKLERGRLLNLEPKTFVWKSNNKEDFGYIAEEVKEIIPELYRDDGTTKGYAVDKLPFYIIELLKQQQKTIEELKVKITNLENRQ
jgi:hypothetical protein